VIAPDLIDPERDPLVFSRILTFDHQHRNAVDQKHHVFPGSIASIVEIKLFGDFVDIAPIALGLSQITIIDQRDVQLAVFFGAKKLMLVAQRVQKIAIAIDVRVKPLEFAHQRTLGFFVFRIKGEHLRVQQVAEEK
jgi:hypothetical protein